MATLNDLWKLILETPKPTPETLTPKISSQIPILAVDNANEVVIFRAWKGRPLLSFSKEAYARFYAILQPFEKDFPNVVEKGIKNPEHSITNGTIQQLRQRALPATTLISNRYALPWLAVIHLAEWVHGRSGSHYGRLRNAIESALLRAQETVSTPEEELPPNDILDILTKPTEPKEVIMDNMDQFRKNFLKEAAKDPQGQVGTKTVSKLVKEHGVKRALDLARDDWLKPIVSQGGRRIGAYKAGPKMDIQVEGQEVVIMPDDPIDRARWLISQKTVIERRVVELQEELASLHKQLEQIEQAEELLARLKEVMK